MKNLFSKTINDSNTDLEKFSSSKVMQLAKKMESSKSTACHIKQVASEPQAAQVNLMRHQRTDLPQTRASRNNNLSSADQRVTRGIQVNTIIKCHSTSRILILTKPIKEKIYVQSVVIQSI